MKAIRMECELRVAGKKGDARKLRRAGLIPAVIYGQGRPAVCIQLSPKQIAGLRRSAHRFNSVIELVAGDANQLAMVVDVQKDPLTREVMHVDFFRVDPERLVTVKVPLVRTAGRALGEQAGGKLHQQVRTIDVQCKPFDTPQEVVCDVSEMRIGQRIFVDQVALPEGVSHAFKVRYSVFTMAGGREMATTAGAEEATAGASA